MGKRNYPFKVRGGLKKAELDIKQFEKKIVKECWEAWQLNKSSYKNDTVFAGDMLDKFRPEDPNEASKHLSSIKVITGWCRKWRVEAN